MAGPLVLYKNFAATNPATIAPGVTIVGAAGTVAGDAVYAVNYPWTIANYGTLQATGTSGIGVDLVTGGSLGDNGLVTGYKAGVAIGKTITAAAASISNAGTIASSGIGSAAIYAAAPASVLNLGVIISADSRGTGIDPIGSLGPEWQFDGTGDFLGDGKQGFLIRNTGAVEPGTLDVGEVVNGAAQYTQIGGVGTEWDFEGTGDFLGDGHIGFLLWNSGSAELGAMAIGEVVNGTLQFTDIGGVGPEWQFIGTGNYIDSNKTDFLMRNANSGALVVGSVSGSTGNGSVTFTTVGGVGPEWTFHNTTPALLA